jgi:adenylate cyclase
MARMLGLAAIVALLMFALTRMDFLQGLENRTLDLRFKAQPTPHDPRIVIVAVDGASLERMDWLGWPWPRQIYADLLGLMRRWGASVVAFDVVFDLPSVYSAYDDMMLGDSAASFGSTVFALTLKRGDGSAIPSAAVMPVGGDLSGLDSATSCSPPWETLLPGAAALGNVGAYPDPDGVYRSVELLTSTPSGAVPTLAVAAAWLAAGRPDVTLDHDRLVFGGNTLPLVDGRLQLRFRGPGRTFEQVPVADLMESLQIMTMGGDTIPADSTVFEDAIVLVGYTASGLYDLKPTPYSSVYPGVEVHATTIDNLLSGTALMRPHPAWALAAGLALSVLCILAFRLRLSVPLQFLAGLALLGAYAAGAFRAFASDVWIEATYPLSAGLLSMLGGSVMSYSQASRQRREIRAAFSQYLSPAVVEQLSRHPEKLRLGGEQKIMTVYFSDLAGFTSFSEKLTPEELVHLLNRYLTLMTDTVLENEGTLDKYIGDAIVAFWNAPLPCPDHAAKALETVLLMKQGLAELNAGLQAEGLFPLRPRTGLNTGLMTVGNMGSSRRFDYTVMGSSVNLASRLEGVNKVYGTSVMVTRDTVEAAGGGFSFRELDTIRVMGQVTPVTIFELLGSPDEAAPRAGSLGPYAEALALYRRGEFRRAAEVFGATGGDPPSAAMASRCAALASDPPQEWDGVFDMTSK